MKQIVITFRKSIQRKTFTLQLRKTPFFLCFISLTLFSQTEKQAVKDVGILTGKIIDYKTKAPLPFANIVCKDKAKIIVSGGITNKKGFFLINDLPLDSLFIEIQFIGYKPLKKALFLSKKKSKINLNTILLKEDIQTLDQIEIQSETSTITQKIDRQVINIGKDLASIGTNSFELLENIPSIEINFQTGTVSLKGNNNVRVLIDGKPSNLTPAKLLKQIPSASVDKVEIITNPSAKFSPEGMSGIINIILKKNTLIGFNGSINLSATHSINTRTSSSLNLNYRTGKVNIYSNYSFDMGNFETFALFDRSDKQLTQNIDYLDNSKSNYLKTGIDFYVNKKSTLSFFTSQSFTKTDFSINTTVFENNNLVFKTPNLSIFNAKESTYNIDYKKDIDNEGQSIEFEINFTKTTNPQHDFNKEKINPSSKLHNYTNIILNNKNTFLANIDYEKTVSSGKLELGLEVRIQNAFNNIITDQEIETTNSNTPKGISTFTYDRDIYSGYISYSKKIKKIAFQGGLRFEHFTVNGLFSNTQQANLESYSDKIFTVYPSAYLTYYASDKNEFQLGYSRRVDRPGTQQVSPIQEWVSPLTISIGNRELEPQFTNSLEINYKKKLSKGYFTFGGFYRRTSNKIGRIINKDVINSDRQILSYENYKNADSYGVDFSSLFKLTKWWSIRPSSSLYIQDSQGLINNKKESIKNTLFRIRLSTLFKASKKLRFQLSGYYKGRSEGVQFKVAPYFLVSAAARLSVLKGKGSLSLRAKDIFDNYKLAFSSTNPFPQTGNYTLEYSAISLSFSYNFGNGKKRKRSRKLREQNETQSSGGVL